MKRVAGICRPEIFVCENVSSLVRRASLSHALNEFLNWDGYTVHYFILNTEHYGIPQNRERVFFVGIRDDKPYLFRTPKKNYWYDKWRGWAEFLGVSDDKVIMKRSGGKKQYASHSATPTALCSEQMVIAEYRHKRLRMKIANALGISQRYLSIKEYMQLQGFPENFIFTPIKENQKQKLICNAWSVPVARAIAEETYRVLNLFNP
jgi:DNA (cytosine-5)-methyltransferase 1